MDSIVIISVFAVVLLVVFLIFRLKIKNQEYLRQIAEMEQERYRIAAEIANDILFEYDIKEDSMRYADKYAEIFGRNQQFYRYTECMEEEEYIHAEDFGAFERYLKLLLGGKQMVEAEYRMRDAAGDFVWCHVFGKTIYDNKHQPVKIIGKLVNIDNQKKELERLQRKAQLDPYTNIYNKMVTKERIEGKIQTSRPQDKHAFLILDIDDFKTINDVKGHLVGDEVIAKIVGQLKKMFRDNDIIGRVGGDEFVVFMTRISSRDDVEKKIISLLTAISSRSREDDLEMDISCSIGISVFPMDGDCYEELMDKADKALYNVKNSGKGAFGFFQ